MTVKTMAEAWMEAGKIFPTDYELNEGLSRRAGYNIYTSTVKDDDTYALCQISDLTTRLEVTVGAKSTNIWVKENEEEFIPIMFTEEELKVIHKALLVYSIKYSKKADKSYESNAYDLGKRYEGKSFKADDIRHRINIELAG